jgi:hypothetical protein
MVDLSKSKSLFSEANVPPGGTCLSSFVVVSNGRGILVGKMAKPELWIEKFLVGPKFAPIYAGSGKYILPARHLHWYESPLDAAESVLRDMVGLGVPKDKISLLDVQSHVSGDVRNEKEPPHWDICFLYRVEVSGKGRAIPARPAWFSELSYQPLSSLRHQDFTRGHGDVLEAAGMLKSRRK